MRKSASLSRTLAFVLRHRPDSIGLHLDAGGWASVDELLERLAATGTPVDRAALEAVVATNDKQRFAFDDAHARIRASQGHSLAVDLGYESREPPPTLYHGTATRFLRSIDAHVLLPQSRQHVHLSADADAARGVGARHGMPVVLVMDAARMHRDGRPFFRSDNGVWLTGAVPPAYLSRQPAGS